jgi:hypothetical protein
MTYLYSEDEKVSSLRTIKRSRMLNRDTIHFHPWSVRCHSTFRSGWPQPSDIFFLVDVLNLDLGLFKWKQSIGDYQNASFIFRAGGRSGDS